MGLCKFCLSFPPSASVGMAHDFDCHGPFSKHFSRADRLGTSKEDQGLAGWRSKRLGGLCSVDTVPGPNIDQTWRYN